MCPVNDFTQEYLEKQIEALDKNSKLTSQQVKEYKENYKNQLENYLQYKKTLESLKGQNDAGLNTQEMDQVKKRKKEVQDQLMKDMNDATSQLGLGSQFSKPIQPEKSVNFIGKFKFW